MWWWIVATSEMRRRPGRTLLTLLSVSIGVAAVLAVWLAMDNTRNGWQQLYETVGGRAALEVQAQTGESFAPEVLDLLAKTPGIRAAVPAIQRPTVLYAGPKRVRVLALGVDPQKDGLVRDYAFREGGPLTAEDQVLLEAGFAKSVGVGLGDEVKLLTRRGFWQFTVVGLLEPNGAAAFNGGSIVFLVLDQAQDLFRAGSDYDTIYLVLAPGITVEEMEKNLAQILPQGLTVRPPASRTEVGRETLLTLEQGLALTGNMSLIAAAFIILNGFFMNLTERWRQLATLRAVGGTRRQVLGLVLAEGLILGIAGSFAGALVGFGGAVLLTRGMEGLLEIRLPPIHFRLDYFLSVVGVGTATSLVAVALPAWFASRISPLDGLRGITSREGERSHPWPTRVGLLLLAGSCALLLPIRWGWLSLDGTALTLAAGATGLVCLIPAATGPLVRCFSPLLRWMIGLEGRLASRQVLRRRMRTSLTACVLFVVLVTSVSVGNAVLDNVDDIRGWYKRTIVADFFVRALMPDMATGSAAPLPEELGDRIRGVAGVDRVEMLRFVHAETEETPIIVIARSFDPDVPLTLNLVDGDPAQALEGLRRGEAVISTVLALRTGLGIGDELTLTTPKGPRRFKIAATTNEYLIGGLVAYVDFRQAKRLLDVTGVDAFLVRAKPGAQAEVEPVLRKLCDQDGLLFQSFAELTRIVDGMVNGVVGGLWVLMALSFVVAAFGMANTLTMNVLEQTRELGLLRVVAMTRGQVRKFVVAQAVAIAAVGLLPGVFVGALIGYLLNLLTYPLSGHPVEFVLRPQILLGSLAVSFLIVLVAAFFPARRAARLNMVEAIQYE